MYYDRRDKVADKIEIIMGWVVACLCILAVFGVILRRLGE